MGQRDCLKEGDPNAPLGLIINTGRNNKNKIWSRRWDRHTLR